MASTRSAEGVPGHARRVPLSVLAALLVYFNVAALNAQFAANFPGIPALPVIDLLVDPFFLFGMFNGYERTASELTIQGLRGDDWQALSAREFLPGPPAEHALWTQASRKLGELLPERVVLKERARFLERIQARHNRLHPERTVARVRIGILSWPKSSQDHETLRVPGQETFTLLYEQ